MPDSDHRCYDDDKQQSAGPQTQNNAHPNEVPETSPDYEASVQRSTRSQSTIPWPFDSGSSLAEENPRPNSRSLAHRMVKALHPHKSYPAGYRKGKIEQIVRSRKRLDDYGICLTYILQSVDEYPTGYSKVAGIENLDSEFLIYRKFGWLHNYALLHLQDELNELQEELEAYDKWEFRDGQPRRMTSRRLDYGRQESRRKELMSQIHQKLKQYDEALLRMQQVQALKRPTVRTQRNVNNLVMNSENLVLEEADWIREGPDLAALGYGSDRGWLNTVIEDAFNMISRRMTKASFSIYFVLFKTTTVP
ncbi:hypothetical protein ACLMJK_008425 [Lecanora helva]